MSFYCDTCEKEITKEDEYIKYKGERFCSECYESDVVVSYFIGGEFLATDGDGVEEHAFWNIEEREPQ